MSPAPPVSRTVKVNTRPGPAPADARTAIEWGGWFNSGAPGTFQSPTYRQPVPLVSRPVSLTYSNAAFCPANAGRNVKPTVTVHLSPDIAADDARPFSSQWLFDKLAGLP